MAVLRAAFREVEKDTLCEVKMPLILALNCPCKAAKANYTPRQMRPEFWALNRDFERPKERVRCKTC